MLVFVTLGLLSCALDSAEPEASATTPPGPPNIVLILMDDMRYDDLWAMPWVSENLAPMGLSFDRAYVSTPVCCPARASIAAGGFLAQSTGVLNNNEVNGGSGNFNDRRTLSSTLQDGGYRTGFIGKYLHHHPALTVPRGWSWWNLPSLDEDWNSYDTTIGASTSAAPSVGTSTAVNQYLTDYISDQALGFIEAGSGEPFFLWINHWAPHFPATPAPEDAGTYADARLRPPSYIESDVSDKPYFVQVTNEWVDAKIDETDDAYRNSMESLLAADRAVRDLVEKLDELGELDNTVIIFTSDNGYLYGEHRMTTKGMAYQESVRVPLIVVAPGGATGRDDRLVSVTLDVAATIQDLALVVPDTEGDSLRPILEAESVLWRETMLIEGYEVTPHPSFTGAIGPRWKYVEYVGGDRELYDLVADPYEMTSRHDDTELEATMLELSDWLDGKRGIQIATNTATMTVGVESSIPMEASGGTPPYDWTPIGDLPAGLSLSSDGILSGTPETAGTYSIGLTLIGSATRAHSDRLETYISSVTLTVEEADGSSGFAPVESEARVTVSLDRIDVEIEAPPGFPVYATLSPNHDFGDGRRLGAMGPNAHIAFEGLRPGGRYAIYVQGAGTPVVHEVQLPR